MRYIVPLLLSFFCAPIAWTQDQDKIQQLEERLKKLEEQMKEQRELLDQTQKELEQEKEKSRTGRHAKPVQEDQQEQILDLERKLKDLEEKQSRSVSANPLTVLNPTVTVFGDFLWRFDDKKVFLENDPAEDRIDDTVNLREAEFDLRGAVDPYVNAVTIFSIEAESPDEYEASVEEFYAIVKALPVSFWEKPPLGTQIKLGRFLTEFGWNNQTHVHDLPQSDRPLVIQELLGDEGMSSSGISFTSFLPSPGDTALRLTGQVVQGGGVNVAQDRNHLAYLLNLNFFIPISDEHQLNTSMIGFYGANDSDNDSQSRVLSLDMLYWWKPVRQGEYRSFLLGGQIFWVDHEFPIDADDLSLGSVDTSPYGYYAFAQYQLGSRFYAGTRWDWTQALDDDETVSKRLTPYLTWYSSEFFRARLSYEHTWSDDPLIDDLDTYMLEVLVILGAHPPEPYWVKK